MFKLKVFTMCFLLCAFIVNAKAINNEKARNPAAPKTFGGSGSSNPFGGKPADLPPPPAPKNLPKSGGGVIDDDGSWDDFTPPTPSGSPSGLGNRNSGSSNSNVKFGGTKPSGKNSGFGGNPGFAGSGLSGFGTGGGENDAQAIFPIVDIESGNGEQKISSFNFPDAELEDIVKAIGKLTGQKFILTKELKGKKISILTYGEITVKDAWRAFLTSLEMNDLTIVKIGELLKIVQLRNAMYTNIRTYKGDTPSTSAFVTSIIGLKHISAVELSNSLLRQITARDARYIAFDQTNTIIACDTAANIHRIYEIIQALDTSGHEEKLEVIKIKNAQVSEIANLLDSLIPDVKNQGNSSNRFRSSGFGSSASSGFSKRTTSEGGSISNLVPHEATNSLLVKANAKGLQQIREVIEKIDIKGSETAGKINVIYIKYGDAEKINTTLQNLTQGSGGDSRFPSLGANTAKKPGAAQLFEGAVKVSADKETNSLVVTASPQDFKTVKAVIAKLDIPRDQVYIETTILEVNMSRTKDFKINVAAPAAGIGLLPDSSDFVSWLTTGAPPSGGSVVFYGGNKRYDITTGTGSSAVTKSLFGLQGLFQYMQNNSIANLLATPQIMATDNEDALIKISDAFFTNETTYVQGSPNPVSTPKKNDIPLNVKIKPMISKESDNIKLKIDLDYNSKNNQKFEGSALAFGLSQRSAQTTVSLRDKETVVIGGLLKDDLNEIEAKIPFLGDIPIIGWLFKSNHKEVTKTNLLVFLTPRIIRSADAREITAKKIKERKDFIENEMGTEDLRKSKIDKLKESAGIKKINKDSKKTEAKKEEQVLPSLGNSDKEKAIETKPEPELIPRESSDKKENSHEELKKEDIPPPPLSIPSTNDIEESN